MPRPAVVPLLRLNHLSIVTLSCMCFNLPTHCPNENLTPLHSTRNQMGAVRNMASEEVKEAGTEILLSNTFHLMLRPGTDVIEAAGDLHDFMRWDGPILTDSGGFQVIPKTLHR